MKAADSLLKNEHSKRLYHALGIRRTFGTKKDTRHYRMPLLLEEGYKVFEQYAGPEIPSTEWSELKYMTYPSDPATYFAPLTSATGEEILRGFWESGKPDLDGVWTASAERAPTLVNYIKLLRTRYGRVQLIRQAPNSLRETRWALHVDDNNRLNPETNGWIVRLWLQLTDDPQSCLILRENQFDKKSEVRIPLPQYTQVVIDSERMFHAGYHAGPGTRYALITSIESTEHLQDWIASRMA